MQPLSQLPCIYSAPTVLACMQYKSGHCKAEAEIRIQVQVIVVLLLATTSHMPNCSMHAIQQLDYFVVDLVQVTKSCKIQKRLMH